jgi:hypothetical protein
MTEENRFRVAITGSLKFVEQGEHAEALKLLDDAIAEAKRAKQYAKRSHTAILRHDDDEVLKQGLLDLLLKHWLDIAEKPG